MATAKEPIVVILREQSILDIFNVPHGQVVFVRDYDIEHHWCEEEELRTDSKGDQYFLTKFTAKSTSRDCGERP